MNKDKWVVKRIIKQDYISEVEIEPGWEPFAVTHFKNDLVIIWYKKNMSREAGRDGKR